MHNYRPVSHQRQPSNDYQNINVSGNMQNYNANQMSYPDQEEQALKNPTYPSQENPQLLGESQLRNLSNQMNALQMDIVANNKEIRLLNNKITKSDFQQSQLKKLFQKEQKLHQKRIEFEEIFRNHEHLKRQMMQNKQRQSQIKHSLGRQYQNIVEQKRRLNKQQKQKQVQQQANMISYNQQAIMYEKQRKKQSLEQQKRLAQQDLRQRQYIRELERQQKQKQKQQYNQVLNYRNQLQTQKDHVYRQYYNHFNEEQEKLQSIYKNRAMEADSNKEKIREENQKRNFETFQMRMARDNQEKLRKITQQKQSLKTFLQTQIEESNKRKIRQREEELKYQSQVKSYQINLNSYEFMQKQKKKQHQRRYDNELAHQIQQKNRLSLHGIEDALRSSYFEQNQRVQGQSLERKPHNPVTNPIDFKIGITNPYVIKEYENTKQKYMGDHNLKLRNLALIGNHSLMNEKR